jgi:hypothetical protein
MTAIVLPGHLIARPKVGDDILACAVIPGYLILIESHVVDGYLRGDGAEVVAIATRSWPSEDGRFWEINWVGAAPGHPEPTLGVAFYDLRGCLTVLGQDRVEVAAA